MNSLDKIFTYYDKLIAPMSQTSQAMLSALLLAFLIWQIYMIIKSGHWIFIAALIIFLPGTWPAAKLIGHYIWLVIVFLSTRAQSLID